MPSHCRLALPRHWRHLPLHEVRSARSSDATVGPPRAPSAGMSDQTHTAVVTSLPALVAAKLSTLQAYLDAQDKSRRLPLAVIAVAIQETEEETARLLEMLSLEKPLRPSPPGASSAGSGA